MIAKTLIHTFLLVTLSVVFFGFSQAFAQNTNSSSAQGNLKSVKDWQQIAEFLSNDVSQMIIMADSENLQHRHIQILQTDNSPFSKALESFLVTEMTHLGLRVNREKAEDYKLYWSVQLASPKHAVRDLDPKTSSTMGAASYGPREIIVNITIQAGHDVVYRLSNIYNINEQDLDKYHFSKDLYYADKDVRTRTVYVRSSDQAPLIVSEDTVDKIFFEFDKHNIQDQYKDTLDEYVEFMQQNPDMHLLLEGHTDIIGSEQYNLDLSLQRAKAVHEYFVQHGVSSERLQTDGYGFSKPIAPNFTQNQKDNPEGRAKNRRVEISPKKTGSI